jgi:hypothetical protein
MTDDIDFDRHSKSRYHRLLFKKCHEHTELCITAVSFGETSRFVCFTDSGYQKDQGKDAVARITNEKSHKTDVMET